MATDEVQIVLTALSNGWLKANTDNRLPTFKRIFDQKRIDLGPDSDWVLGWAGEQKILPFGLGTPERETYQMYFSIRTKKSRDHSLKVRDEFKRIIRANKLFKASNSFFDIIRLDTAVDRSDKMSLLFRWEFTVIGEAFNAY